MPNAGMRDSPTSIRQTACANTNTNTVEQHILQRRKEHTLTAVDLARVAVDLHGVLVAEEDDDGREAADERAPALVREDVREERAAAPQVRAVRRDGRGHGVVAPDADAEDDAPDPEPDERAGRGDAACSRADGE